MGRTSIEIDDELVERVMRRYRLPRSRDEALAMEGSGWSGDLGLREPDNA
jgi:hypothetical protein